MSKLFNKIEFITSYGNYSQLPEQFKPSILFAGQSNAGKSSLINSIANRKNLARVSQKPGKTATINLFSLGDDHVLIDVPGFGYAKRSREEKDKWADLMYDFFQKIDNILLGILVSDIRRELSDEAIGMLDLYNRKGIPFIIVLTKSDKLNKSEISGRLAEIAEQAKAYNPDYIVTHSIRDKVSTESLKEIIEKAVYAD
ncbi:MAG: ribosome biogenesis GTP-binding protein YsxC [Oscillospiraceae bacterium]|nr:ribosome biogenesis GTP-binding protein YsxC [Oscillospiraceae bacterium]